MEEKDPYDGVILDITERKLVAPIKQLSCILTVFSMGS